MIPEQSCLLVSNTLSAIHYTRPYIICTVSSCSETSKLNNKSLIQTVIVDTLNTVLHFYQTRSYGQPVDQSHTGLKWSTYKLVI